jgi:hypothetical protein
MQVPPLAPWKRSDSKDRDNDCYVAVLLGHALGAPGVMYEMTDPTISAPEAVGAIESRFPQLL